MHRPGLALLLALLIPTLSACDGQGDVNTPPQPTAAPTATPSAAPTSTAVASAQPVKPSIYPATAKRPVVDEYHGVKITDDYRWLEDPSNPEVKGWIGEQHKRTRAYLDAAPGRQILRDKIKGILTSTSADRFGLKMIGKDKVFALKAQPPKQQEFLVLMSPPDKAKTEADLKERVLVDPNVIDPKGRTTIDWYEPSPDGKFVAVSLSVGGSESGTVHVYDVEKGAEQGDTVSFAHSGTAGGSLAWAGDGKGFYYTRHPHKGEVKDEDLGFFQQVYFHKLGTKDTEDKSSLGKDLPRIAENVLETSKDGKWVVDSIQNGDGGEYWHYLLDTKSGKWARFADIPDKVIHASFGPDNKLYLISIKDAPKGKVLRIDPAKPDLAKADVLVPSSDVTIQGLTATKSKLYVKDLVGGPSQVRIFDLKGKAEGNIPLPPVSSVRGLVSLTDDDVLFRSASYTEPVAWYSFHPKLKESVHKTVMATTSSVSFADAEAVRESCTSKDGTKVPINIIRKKGTKLDGQNPTVLTGYGGYGVSLQPGNNPLLHVWLDMGGVFAIANLRGGGEFGEEWHRAGNLAKKQNVFDDFYGCARYLVDSKYTSSQKLAIEGGSNGGLLMGAEIVQHPDMYKAVVSFVGIYDMLRVETTPNGAFNVTEFGTVKDPDLFKALYAYSPYHNVKDGTAYPSVMFLTGANDPRVEPYNSRKMTARLQAATTGGAVMLRVNENTGHGIGTPLEDEIDEQADVYAFLAKELDIPVK